MIVDLSKPCCKIRTV